METADQRRGLQSYPPPSALLSFNRRPPTPPTIPAPPPSPVASFRAEAGVSMAPGSTVHEPVLGETPLWPEDSRPHSVAFCLPCINEVFLRHQSRPPQVFCKQFQSRGTHTLYGVTNTGIHLPVVSVGLCHRTQLVAAWTAPHVRFRDPSKSTRRREGGLSLLQAALQALAFLTQPPPHMGGAEARRQQQGSPTPEPCTGTSLQPSCTAGGEQHSFLSIYSHPQCIWASQAALTVKNPPATAGEEGD